MIKNLLSQSEIINTIIFRFDENNDSHFASVLWTNVLANIAALITIFVALLTIVYLVSNILIKLGINSEIKKLLNYGFLISNLENMTFFSLIEYIRVFNDEELKQLKKKLRNQFKVEGTEKSNLIENQMLLYKNVFTNFKTWRRLIKWNKVVDILRRAESSKFKNITHLNIIKKDQKIILAYEHEAKQYKKMICKKKLVDL